MKVYRTEQQVQTPGFRNFGAHEFLGITEALQSKATVVETLAALSRQTKDAELENIMRRHAQSILDHYNIGVNLLKGQVGTTGMWMPTPTVTEPQLGLNNPTYPAPNLNAQDFSEKTLAGTVLQLYKYHALAWLQIALECSNPQFRSYLMEGTLLSDRMAYDMFIYMNQKGFYQVPQLPSNMAQTITNAYAPYSGYTTPTSENIRQ